ncbi:unnamed protein product [Clonostachys rosea]|uniref:Uncharacterized protein n=1 Tax=Bionectria ochroleuca TaxID=29856 RepID=A0ABY6V428_BIOOC|nr:unnamed protein product [Clonostachys rosea]
MSVILRKFRRKERKKMKRLGSRMTPVTTNDNIDTVMSDGDSDMDSQSMYEPTHVPPASSANQPSTQPTQVGVDNPSHSRISGDNLPLTELTHPHSDELVHPHSDELAHPHSDELAHPHSDELAHPHSDELAHPHSDELAHPHSDELAHLQSDELAQLQSDELACAQLIRDRHEEIEQVLSIHLTRTQSPELTHRHSDEFMHAQFDELTDAQCDELIQAQFDELAQAQSPELTHLDSDELTDAQFDELVQAQFDEPARGQSPELTRGQSPELTRGQSPKLTQAQPDELTHPQSDELMSHGISGRDFAPMGRVQLNATVSDESTTAGTQFANQPGQVQAGGSSAGETFARYRAYIASVQAEFSRLYQSSGTAPPVSEPMEAQSGILLHDGENGLVSHLIAWTLHAMPWRERTFGVSPLLSQPPRPYFTYGTGHSISRQFTAQVRPETRPGTSMSDGGSSVTLSLEDHALSRSVTPMSDGGSSVTLDTGEPQFWTGTPVSDDTGDDSDDMSDDRDDNVGHGLSNDSESESSEDSSDDSDDYIDDDDFDDDGYGGEAGDAEDSEMHQAIIEDLWEELRDGKVRQIAVSDPMAESMSDCTNDVSDGMHDADDAQTENRSDDINADGSGSNDESSWNAPIIIEFSPTQVETHTLSVESSDANHHSAEDGEGEIMDDEGTGINNPSLVHPTPLRVQPDVDSIIDHAETSANEGEGPFLSMDPNLTWADCLRRHLAECMEGHASGTGLTSVQMCYLPEVAVEGRLEKSVALRGSVNYFCSTRKQFYNDTLEDVDVSFAYYTAAKGIRDELEEVILASRQRAGTLVTPELLAALTLTERTLKLFIQGEKAPEFARLCRNVIAALWLLRGPPDLNDPLDTAVSHEIHGLLLREGCEVDISRIDDAQWHDALEECAVRRPTTEPESDTDNRACMLNDQIKLHEYTARLEPLFSQMRLIREYPRLTTRLARIVRFELQWLRNKTLWESARSIDRGGERTEHDLWPAEEYYGKHFYLQAVMLAHLFQKMCLYDYVPLQIVYEMSFVVGMSPSSLLDIFRRTEDGTPTVDVWIRIPQPKNNYFDDLTWWNDPLLPRPMSLLPVHVAVDSCPSLIEESSIMWFSVDDRRLLNIEFRDLIKLRLHSALRVGQGL